MGLELAKALRGFLHRRARPAQRHGRRTPVFYVPVFPFSQLLKAETAEREVRSIAYQIKAARFPVYKDLTGFDFASSDVNEALVRRLTARIRSALFVVCLSSFSPIQSLTNGVFSYAVEKG